MADALRGSMDAAEYKHVVLGLIFLKYISDVFEEQPPKLVAERGQGADPEDPDECRAQGSFGVPPEARWPHLKAQARQSKIGQIGDEASRARDVLGRVYEYFLYEEPGRGGPGAGGALGVSARGGERFRMRGPGGSGTIAG